MASATLSRRAMCGNVAAKLATPVCCLAAIGQPANGPVQTVWPVQTPARLAI